MAPSCTILLAFLLLLAFVSANSKSLYEVLELKPDAAASDIKKAYRNLALKHHPDRNNGSKESTEKFAAIAEAYETLSDPQSRREYDLERKSTSRNNQRQRSRTRRSNTDAYTMFDDLFTNDPFFAEAFKEMDDLFTKTFKVANKHFKKAQKKEKKSWFVWFLSDFLGLNFQLTTSYQGADGSYTTSTHASSQRGSTSRSSVSKSSKVITENGRRIEIKEMMKDGNSIKEKYVDGVIDQRWINGEVSEVERVETLGGNTGAGKKRKKKRKKKTEL
ncbi:hypothetical protein TrLO_g13896 [Triparma laevis f. longispina]|uniref:J domain-containing protein n=2 Tax=Triparma laevis TaxID=1534972 RepID=A0A9W7C085_9STRA|nr:hypothetical protein TrLO_g13896 [Triparma laevis f. longispina]